MPKQQAVYIVVRNRKSMNRKTKLLDSFEEVSFTSKLSKRDSEEAVFIIDFLGAKVVKNRFAYNADREYTFDSIMIHLIKNHKSVAELVAEYETIIGAIEAKANSAYDSLTQVAKDEVAPTEAVSDAEVVATEEPPKAEQKAE